MCNFEYKYPDSSQVISRAFGTPEEAADAKAELESYGAIIIKPEEKEEVK